MEPWALWSNWAIYHQDNLDSACTNILVPPLKVRKQNSLKREAVDNLQLPQSEGEKADWEHGSLEAWLNLEFQE